MKKNILSLAILFYAAFLCAQPIPPKAKLIEKISSNGTGELCIPYSKYVLPNGLTLLVSEDHSDPVVHTEVMYHVGSARETEGRSGFAHFFEHMMFQGSGHVADEEHFHLVTEAGGTMNGNTTTDRTTYFETMPSNNLELSLWLESDRMGFLLDSVTQKKFEVQRSTVKNERGQNYDNAPYGLVWEKIGQAMFPEGHPYSWETIGYIADLNAASVTDLRNFFMRWYGPNNATLVIAGDVKTDDVVALVEKYFGPIPRGPEVKPMAKMPVTIPSDRYISYEDNIRFPQLTIALTGVPTFDADEPALDALSNIISEGKSSVFYKTFVESKVAQSANMYDQTEELAGMIAINIKTFPGHTLREADSLVQVALNEFEKRGVTDDDLKRYKLYVEGFQLDQLTTVSDKAGLLAVYQTFYGNPNLIQKDLDRYQKLTKEDVMRVYNKYIKNKSAVILSVYPKGHPELKAHADNYTPPSYKSGTVENAEYKNLTYRRPVDNFDRSVHPIPGPTPTVNVPGVWKDNFPNGLQLIGTQSTEIPRTYLLLSISAGQRQEDTSQAGIGALLVKMLDQSTIKHSAADIETQLELLGSEVSITQNETEINVFVKALSRNLDSTLALVNEKIFQPKWDPTEFDLMKKQQLEAIANMSTNASAMASFVYNKMIFGANNIMGYPRIGTASTVLRLTIDDLKAYYNKLFSPNISRFVVVTDLSVTMLTPKLNFLRNWKSTNAVLKTDASLLPKTIPGPTTIYLFNKPEAAQSEIRVGRLAMPYDAEGEFYQATVMNYELGGNFNSHINLKLREEKAWTYGAGSYFNGSHYTGTFTAYAGVRTDASDSSVVEFMKAIKNYANNGITQSELDYTKKAISQREALKYEDPYSKLFFLKNMVDYNLPNDYAAQQNKILQSMTIADVNALAKKWLDPDHMVISVTGDKAKIGDALSKLGYQVVEVDAMGNPVVAAKPKLDENKQTPPPANGNKENTSKKKPKGAKYDNMPK